MSLLPDSGPAQAAILFFAPFLHEDVAVVTAAAFIHELGVHPAFAFGWLYGGVVASDLAIYSLGRFARGWGWLRRFVREERIERARRHLQANRVRAIALSRLVPGALFSTLLACGWLGLGFVEFLVPAFLTSAVYTGLMLLLVLQFGEAIVAGSGHIGWYLALGLVFLFALEWLVRRLLRRVLAKESALDTPVPAGRDLVIPGMPPVPASVRKVPWSEKIPPPLFYTPLAVRWLWLGLRHGSLTLPALADPCIEAGGLWGESKSDCLNQITGGEQRWVAKFVTVQREAADEGGSGCLAGALDAAARAGLAFPLVAKPDIGWQGFGVQVVHDGEELRRYLASYPPGVRVIVQALAPWDGEAGVLYVRRPGAARGAVTSVTLRYFPQVQGDGRASVRELIAREPRMQHKSHCYFGANREHRGLDPARMERVPADGEVVRLSFIGSIRIGGLYRDARTSITPALSERFDAIARSMPEFHFGRFDVRFASLEHLQQGEDFLVIEVNGAGAEAIHMWDPEMPLVEAYRELLRYQDLVFELGAANRARGFAPLTLREFLRFTLHQNRLIRGYPPSG